MRTLSRRSRRPVRSLPRRSFAAPPSAGSPARIARPSAPLALLALAAGAASCGRATVVLPSEPVLVEVEPNDDRWHANVLGMLYEEQRIVVAGHVGPGWIDPQDGFALFAGATAPVRVRLLATDPLADLDLCVYDPLRDELVACFASPAASEQGEFVMLGGGGEFQLVVSAFAGASSWRLEIESGCACALELAQAADSARETLARAGEERTAPVLARLRGGTSVAADERASGGRILGRALLLEPGAARVWTWLEDRRGQRWLVPEG